MTTLPIVNDEDLEAKREQLALLEQKIKLQEGIPFLYGWKWYAWAREFYESTNKLNFLCAANQISKSSTQIRKCLNWATDQKLWPLLWRKKPVQFWYLYPTSSQATIEFETKWQEFLPQGEYKDHPVYGWRVERKNKEVFAIHFNSGVHLYFKTYAQDVQALQTGTVDAIFCDEELPVDLYEELMFRISAADGYFHMVFTATLGQDFWRRVIEPSNEVEELLTDAAKWVVSMYDCMKYEDGSPSHWTREKIQMVINRCSSHNEVLKRVWGRFVGTEGRKYPQFDIKRHVKTEHPIPENWLVFGGADIGSGGEKGHMSAIAFVAVAPDFRQGRVFHGWRGDGVETTAGDVVEKFIELKNERKLNLTAQFYDWACKDFDTISTRMGEPFQPADKGHEKGEQVLNVLFKNNMLYLYDTPELQKLAGELVTVRNDQDKKRRKDDFSDALRYAVTRIPWDWSVITGEKPEGYEEPEAPKSEVARQIDERRKAFEQSERDESQRIEDEFAEVNDLCTY